MVPGNRLVYTDSKKHVLSEEHIQKIIDAYAERKDIDKYAHVASLDEIIENDYNLNIPRYVDTSEKEPEIDLNEVFSSIQKTDDEIVKATTDLNAFMRELGLKEL